MNFIKNFYIIKMKQGNKETKMKGTREHMNDEYIGIKEFAELIRI